METYQDAANKISMQLGTVYDTAQEMRFRLQQINDAWEDTMRWWNQLKLSWVGKTPVEVDAFQKAIDKVTDEIFGTSKPDPNDASKQVLDQPGLYQQVREIAVGAVQNYGWTDCGVRNMFVQLSSDITGTYYILDNPKNGCDFIHPDPKPTGRAPDKTDPYITETFH